MSTTIRPGTKPVPDGRRVGILLLVGSTLSVAAMLHHPSVGASGIAEGMAEIHDEAGLARLVHGVLIALIGTWAYAFSVVTARLDGHRPSVRVGWIAYAAGIAAMVGAALLSGFVVPAIVDRYADGAAAQLESAHHLIALAGIGNQVLAQFGVVAMSIGILGWSIALVGAAGVRRVVGGIGVLAGLVPALGVLSGWIVLDVYGMTTVVVAQVVWYLAIAWLLLRKEI